MGLHEAFDARLEEEPCPGGCGHIGMDADGDMDFICPNCGCVGTLESEEDEYLDDME